MKRRQLASTGAGTLLTGFLVIACGAVPPGTGAAETAGERSIFVQVVRWQHPDQTILTLDRRGQLRRLEGSELIVRRHGSRQLPPDAVASLFAQARELHVPAPPAHPTEGDLYLVVDPDGRILSTVDTLASEGLRSFVAAMLREAGEVAVARNLDWYLQAEPVPAARAARLGKAGTKAVALARFPDRLREDLQRAIESIYQLEAIDAARARAFGDEFGGREAFVSIGDAWYQARLWSPP